MAKTNFEKLRVYQLSEDLADRIWAIVLNWNVFTRDTVGRQLVRAADALVPTLQKERAVERLWITGVLYGSPADL